MAHAQGSTTRRKRTGRTLRKSTGRGIISAADSARRSARSRRANSTATRASRGRAGGTASRRLRNVSGRTQPFRPTRRKSGNATKESQKLAIQKAKKAVATFGAPKRLPKNKRPTGTLTRGRTRATVASRGRSGGTARATQRANAPSRVVTDRPRRRRRGRGSSPNSGPRSG